MAAEIEFLRFLNGAPLPGTRTARHYPEIFTQRPAFFDPLRGCRSKFWVEAFCPKDFPWTGIARNSHARNGVPPGFLLVQVVT